MRETITTICNICELDIEVLNENGIQECPKCHHYTYVEQEEIKECECDNCNNDAEEGEKYCQNCLIEMEMQYNQDWEDTYAELRWQV